MWPATASSAFLVLVPLAERSTAMPLLVAAVLGAFATGMLFDVNQLTLRQAIAPERLQGRMNAIVRLMCWSPQAAGFAIRGALASQIGLPGALRVSVIGATVAMPPLAVSPVRRIRALPEPEPSEPPLPEPPAALGVRADA